MTGWTDAERELLALLRQLTPDALAAFRRMLAALAAGEDIEPYILAAYRAMEVENAEALAPIFAAEWIARRAEVRHGA